MNGILCIYKPQGMTSFDVVRKVRHQLKAKVGHNGTLDPMAEGLLIIAVNNATKALPYLDMDDKTYRATLTLGNKTSTGDIWGDIEETKEITHSFLDINTKELLNTFIGKQNQRVPKVSAKKIDGRRSYDYVFNNEEVKTLYTDIEIYDIKEIDKTKDTLTFEASVSKGTYMRTLCEDIAEAIGELGTMSALTRTKIGTFDISDSQKIEDITPTTTLLDSKERISLPKILDQELNMDVLHGKRIQLDLEDDMILVDGGEYFAVYKREKDNIYKSVRGLW